MLKLNLLLFLGALFFWSATWSIIGLTQVNIDLDPTISVFIRFIIAGLIILIFVALQKEINFSLKTIYTFLFWVFSIQR